MWFLLFAIGFGEGIGGPIGKRIAQGDPWALAELVLWTAACVALYRLIVWQRLN